jgi:hypothetical protein
MQALAEVQATPFSWLSVAPVGLGVFWIDQTPEDGGLSGLTTLPDGDIKYQKPPKAFRPCPCATPAVVSPMDA